MRNRFSGYFQLLFGFVLLGFIVWGVYYLLRLYWVSVTSLQSDIGSAIVAASATVIVSVSAIVGGKYFERRQQIEQQQRERKIEIYEEFMEKWFAYILELKKKPTKNFAESDEFVQFFSKFTRKLILWGSNGVVKEYSTFRQVSSQPVKEGSLELLIQFEKVLLEMRKDLGHGATTTIKKGELLSLFINDWQTAQNSSQTMKK